jgi:NMD protein affecting ribosome stability and mRNA decay
MKVERGGFRGVRKEQRMRELRDDSYRADEKLPDPACCPKCGATYRRGRWTWLVAPPDAPRRKCPACQRIDDHFPAGYVTLGGAFFTEHRTEVLNLVKAQEAREKAEHPLQRIMAIEDAGEDVQVTTTDVHLARAVAQAVHDAFKGDLSLAYSENENLVRASWRR